MEKQRKSKRGLLITAFVVFIAGAAMLGGAVIAGAFERDTWADAIAKLRTAQGLYEEPQSVSLSYETGEFSSVDLDVASHGVIVEPGTGDGFVLNFSEDFEGEYSVSTEGGKLTFKQTAVNPQGKGIFKYFQTNLDWVLGFFDGWEDMYKVRLTVPADFVFDKIDIKCTSGAVSLNGIKAGEADIRATSGSVQLDNTEIAGKLALNLTSGDLKLNNVKADGINIWLTSGDATFDKVACAEIDALLTSGKFQLTDTTADEMTAKLTSGSLKVNSCDIKTSRLDLTSGDATFSSLPKHFTSSATAFDIKVTSGSVKVDGVKREDRYVTSPESAAYRIEGKLTSGSFRFE